ncbi:hypothetical protein HJC23_001167 [Cyclotella cryptica]|uniref:Uncharacterized protein n=1 Tax=Cyclotella cryptica TaxID=29204 RepID=A0ABD3QQ71_9STRA|eukprot:CCRYP_003787-RA/>CCRYP_003787-RA protein AED:0.00 eAED:0.00 QI:152/-1/1/1/-1/1/1/924/513
MEHTRNNRLAEDAQSAIIFSSAVIRQLDGPELRLPTTYIGVRRVRPAGGVQARESGLKRKYSSSETSEKLAADVDDDWIPNTVGDDSCPLDESERKDKDPTTSVDGDDTNSVNRNAIVFKITNPDGTERRMTKQEKNKLKYEMKQAKHLARKEERQIQHEERIRIAKEGKRERKKMKRLAKKNKELSEIQVKNTSTSEKNGGGQTKPQPNLSDQQTVNDDEDTERSYRGNPPVMLTPAATRIATEIGTFQHSRIRDDINTTVLDDELSKQWASILQESMKPAEEYREKEDIRPMAYKVVPEVWTRLRPVQLNGLGINAEQQAKVDGNQNLGKSTDKEVEQLAQDAAAGNLPIPKDPHDQKQPPDYSMAVIRDSSPSYDESTYLILRHLHRNSTLHLACGARFGCDFLLYDGRREERHSFAGLRVYSIPNDHDQVLPLPSAYDITGFVRAMNTARKLALVATVMRSVDNPDVARIAIVDLALEKVLTAPTHIRKGNTDKRRCVEDTDALTKRKY